MEPIDFKERNCIYGEGQDEYKSLPAYVHNTKERQVVSCWKLSFFERCKVMFSGKIYMSLMTFGKPLTPSKLTVNKKDVL